MEETGGGGTPLSSPANLFQIFLKYMPILINRWQIDPRRQMRQNVYKSFEASQKQDQLLQHSLNYSVLGASAWNSDNPSSIFSSHWCFALHVFKKLWDKIFTQFFRISHRHVLFSWLYTQKRLSWIWNNNRNTANVLETCFMEVIIIIIFAHC